MTNKLAIFATTAALALSLGFLGFTPAAIAAHSSALVNGDAEAALGAEWSTTGGADRSTNDSGFAPNGGSWFFSTAASTTSGSFTQVVAGIWGCGVEYLQGTLSVSGFVQTLGTDDADLSTGFTDNNGNVSAGPGSANNMSVGSWTQVNFNGLVGINAVSMSLTMTGTDNDDAPDEANVGFDDMEISITGCLSDFAKISGKIGHGRGSSSFEGSVGTLHDGGALVGQISINYKGLKETCTFTHTAATYVNETEAVQLDGEIDCADGDGATNEDVATTIYMVAATESNNSNKNKDRGDICVDADMDQYDINNGGTACVIGDNNPVALNNGNVWVDGDTSTVF